MSAYVMSKEDISVLVAAGLRLASDLPAPDTAAESIGQRLLDECVRSVSYRYPDDDLGNLPGSFEEEIIAPGIEPVTFAQWLTPYAYAEPTQPLYRDDLEGTISSYEYQSCEHPEWEDSWAYAYCISLRKLLAEFPVRPEPTPPPDRNPERALISSDRNETIKAIRAALKRRSGKAWSVTGGKGTAWGWIHIQAPPKRRTGKHVQRKGAAFGEYEHVDTGEAQEFGLMTPADCEELGVLLNLGKSSHCQGTSVPASSNHRREYLDRAEGNDPTVYGVQYWD